MKLYVKVSSISRNKSYSFLIGISAGVILSLISMPLLEDCHNSRNYGKEGWYQQIVSNDYDPVVQLGKIENFTKEDLTRTKNGDFQLPVSRPRFYATELNVKQKLLVTVLSNYLSLAKAINRTIGNRVNKLMYFLDSTTSNNLAKTYLKEVSNAIAILPDLTGSEGLLNFEQEGNFMRILKYLIEKGLIRNYDFVFMMTDQTFVKGQKLLDYVSRFSVSEELFIVPYTLPSAHRESFNADSFSIEAGILLSSSLILKCELDKNCFLDSYLKTSDLKINQKRFNSYYINSEEDLDFKTFKTALTLYPVLHDIFYYQLHLVWYQLALNESLEALKELEQKIESSNLQKSFDNKWPTGISDSSKPQNRFDVIRWSYLSEGHLFMPNDFEVLRPLNDLDKLEVNEIKSLCVEWLKKNAKTNNLKFVNFYRRFDANRGLEYIIDISLSKADTMKRFEIVRPLNRLELIPNVPYVTEHVRIILLLPIRGEEDLELASSFLQQYSNACLKKANHQTFLILLLFYSPNDDKNMYAHIKTQATQIQMKYKTNSAKIAWISILSTKEKKVPTELAFMDLISKKLSTNFLNSLILLCRTTMILTLDFLNRVRLNTIIKYQIFFPIPFVEFRLRSQIKSANNNFDVRKDNGYFDNADFNFVSFYLSDYLTARKAVEHILPIITQDQELTNDIYYESSIDIFQMFLTYNEYQSRKSETKKDTYFIMRAVEPELKLKNEGVNDCNRYESNTRSQSTCERRTFLGMGSKSLLASFIVEDSHEEIDVDNSENEI